MAHPCGSYNADTLEILKDVLHYDDSEINNIVSSGAVGEVNKS
mgnify:CR=1 FL=1